MWGNVQDDQAELQAQLECMRLRVGEFEAVTRAARIDLQNWLKHMSEACECERHSLELMGTMDTDGTFEVWNGCIRAMALYNRAQTEWEAARGKSDELLRRAK